MNFGMFGPLGSGKSELAVECINRYLHQHRHGGTYIADYQKAMVDKIVQGCFEIGVPCIVLDAWHQRPVIPIGQLYLACRPNTPQFGAIKNSELKQIQFITGQQRDYQ